MLFITILDGEDSVNNIRERTAREPIVQVEDENHKPVAGALLLFTIQGGPNGAGATFNGLNTLTVTTDAEGKATAHGLAPNATQGSYSIAVSATVGALVATAIIKQSNAAGGGWWRLDSNHACNANHPGNNAASNNRTGNNSGDHCANILFLGWNLFFCRHLDRIGVRIGNGVRHHQVHACARREAWWLAEKPIPVWRDRRRRRHRGRAHRRHQRPQPHLHHCRHRHCRSAIKRGAASGSIAVNLERWT